ncbi:hypothetical protein KPP03845_107315 [Streptomyces xanthophaeus]|nr:hypothetical protein KPP03845_107315 [Streptomyces xanthophaeus]
MATSTRRSVLRFLAPVVWAAVVLAAGAALWSPGDTDPGLSPLAYTVSDFAALDRGGPIETTMALLGGVSAVLLVVTRKRIALMRGLPSVLLGVWAVGLVVAALVPTDPLTSDLSAPAHVHRYASVLAFTALPAAGLLLSRRIGTGRGAEGTARWLSVLSCAAFAAAVVMAYAAGPGGRELIGLAERVLLGCEVALLGVLGWYVHQPVQAASVRCGSGAL